MTIQENLTLIESKLKQAEKLVKECKEIAIKNGLHFQVPLELLFLPEHYPSDWYNSDCPGYDEEWLSSDTCY